MKHNRFVTNHEADRIAEANKKSGTKQELPPVQQYSFPEYGMTIEAHSQSEAIEKLRIMRGEVK